MSDVRILTARPHRLLQPLVHEIGQTDESGKPCILLVPEQFTLQAERELLQRLNRKGLFSIEVLSPTRLKHRVMETVGADERAPLSAAGQQMAVSFALEACADQLHFYQASVSRRGFAQKLAALIGDMKHGGLTPEALKEYAGSLPDGMHKEKLSDLAVLYEAYQQLLQDKLGDGDDSNQYASEHLGTSGLLLGKYVFVYGFDAMSEPLITLLCAIAQHSERLTVGLISDGSGAADQELYLPVRQSVARFRAALEKHDIPMKEIQLPPEPLAHAPAIAHLDAMLYAHPQKRFDGEQTSIFVSQFNSPFEEATAAARQMMHLIEQGTDPERIAIIYPEQNGYPFAVNAALSDSGLPFYADDKLPAQAHTLVRFLTAALHAVADGYSNEDVFAMLKSGYAPISFDEACMLENYAREFGINYQRWLSPFQKGDEDIRYQCEMLRKKIIQPLIRAREAIVGAKDSSQSLTAVMDLLSDVNAYNTLKREENALLAEDLLVRAGQNSQIWNTMPELFDQLLLLSNGKRIPLKYIAERFEAGFSAISLAALPPAAHMLHAGILGHTLSGEADAVFLLGMNEGILNRATESLLTEEERERTQESTETFLGMTDESRLLFAKLDIKRAMTLPQKQLYLSYARTDPAGSTLQPLDLVSDIADRLFETVQTLSDQNDDLPVSARQAFIMLSGLLRDFAGGDEEQLPDVWRRRLSLLLSFPSTAGHAMQLLRAAGFNAETLPLAPGIARSLFGDRTLSVSRLEEFAACPYRHFVTYGLRPEEQKDWEITPIETGNFFHDSLQRFAKDACSNAQYPYITQEEIQSMAQRATEPLIEQLKQGPMGDGPRSLAALSQATRVVNRACETITDHLAAGSFVLDQAEAKFGYPEPGSFPPVMLHLKDGTEITLHGRIDRVDRYETPDGVYRRVVDYKSGSHTTLNAAELWHGTQLQLMLYLHAVTRDTGDAKPAGAFYFHMFDPLAKTDAARPEDVKTDIKKQLRMDGITLSDPEIISAMDSGNEPVAIPAMLKKSGEPYKNAKALDEKHLDALIDHSASKAAQFSEQMLSGDISVQPVKHGARESCDYCEYRTICGYDPLEQGALGREIFNISFEELTGRLDEQTKL